MLFEIIFHAKVLLEPSYDGKGTVDIDLKRVIKHPQVCCSVIGIFYIHVFVPLVVQSVVNNYGNDRHHIAQTLAKSIRKIIKPVMDERLVLHLNYLTHYLLANPIEN